MRASSSCDIGGNYHLIAREFAGPCLYEGTAAGRCGGIDKLKQVSNLASAGHSTSHRKSYAAAFDSHSDMPWFMLDVERLRAAYPHASFVCTSRGADSWVRSIVDFQNRTTFMPGGLVFMYHIKKMLKRRMLPGHAGPGTFGRATVPDPRALRAYHAWHHNHTCAGLPLLRLEDDSEQKWATFCEAVPRKWRARCRKSASASPWPLINAIGGVQAYRLTFASTAVKNETR